MKLEKLLDNKGRHIEALFFNPASGKKYVRKKRVGKRDLYRSLGDVSVTVAKAMRDRLVAEWLGDDTPEELRQPKRLEKMRVVWEEKYQPYKLKSTTSENTKRNIRVAAKTYILPTFGDLFVTELAERGEELFEEFYSRYPVETSLYNAQKYLNNFLRYCHETLKIIDRKPKIQLPPERSKKSKKYKSQNRLVSRQNRVMLARKAGAWTDMRHLIIAAYRQGNRISEICRLRWLYVDEPGLRNWVEFEPDGDVLIHLNETKTKMARHICADPLFARVLKKRFERRRSEWVFPLPSNPAKGKSRNNFDEDWAAVRKLVGVECKFHDLRHSFLTDKFKEPDKAHSLVCEYAGVTLKEAQETYLHFDHNDTKVVLLRPRRSE